LTKSFLTEKWIVASTALPVKINRKSEVVKKLVRSHFR